jgi:hypothetical protein
MGFVGFMPKYFSSTLKWIVMFCGVTSRMRSTSMRETLFVSCYQIRMASAEGFGEGITDRTRDVGDSLVLAFFSI